MSVHKTEHGIVYLIGAGPGDPGLLGLKAKECLEQADAVVYDRLADPRIIAYANKDAEMIYVGKASANHTMRQEDINQLLVRLALEGKTVARLKGGDPFVFGRGGEEAMELRRHGIRFEFIPGVTSAIAVAEYAGIPVTHRRVATSFAVVTGHEDPEKEKSGIHWQGLATSVDTLVFLMGVENIERISQKLIENGRSADCPAAVIRWGTRPNQETLITTVGTAADDVRRHGLKPPAIFLVGEVVKLRGELRWFDNKPLFGKTIVVTRARAQASKLTKQLEALGAQVIEAPAIEIENVPAEEPAIAAAISALDSYQWLLFTSANGVSAFFDDMKAHGKDSRSLAGIRIAAIGSATAAALKGQGIVADVVPKTYVAEDLAEAIRPFLQAGDRVLLARAKEARNVLPETLRAAGAVVDVLTVYETKPAANGQEDLLERLESGKIDMVTFTSSSTVKNFLALIGDKKDALSGIAAAAIGPITADTCQTLWKTPDVQAKEYTVEGLAAAVEEYYKE